MSHDLNAVFYSHTYHPIQAGSIDGTDTTPHDNAVCRAMLATSTGLYDPTGDAKAQGDPYCTVFVGRLSRDTKEATLHEEMSKYGRIKNLRLVRHIVTGASQGYAFVEYETEKEMRYAYEAAHLIKIDGHQVLVDYNRQLLMPGWIPRRLGGGLGGRKESGQLRFGGRDRPFRKPLRPIPTKELEKLGIPLPGGYMQRFETPPLPKRRSSRSGTKTSQDENAHRSPEKDFRWVSSQEARSREEDDRIWHGQREEKRLARYEEEDAKRYSRSLDKRDSYKEEKHRDHTRLRDYDDKAQLHEREADYEEDSRKPLHKEEGENYGRRTYHWDDNERHAKKSQQCEDDDYKRQRDDRREKTHARGKEDDRRRLDERHQSRSSKQHYLEQDDGRDHYREDSGRSHHRDKHGKKKEDVRRRHLENKEDGNEDSDVKDRHSTRRHKRKYQSGAESTLSDSLSSESEARSKARKVHTRDDNERLQFREPNVENRWKL